MPAYHALSQAQLASLADQMNNPEIQGFSVDAAGPNAGEPPTSPGGLFMVGVKRWGADEIPPPTTARDIRGFVESGGRTTPLSNYRRYALGGWQDPHGTASLDVVRKIPAPEGIDRAVRMAHDQDQWSLGVLGPSGNYIEEIKTVHPDYSQQHVVYDHGQLTTPDYRVLSTRSDEIPISPEEHEASHKAHKYRAVAARRAAGYSNKNLEAAKEIVANAQRQSEGTDVPQEPVPPSFGVAQIASVSLGPGGRPYVEGEVPPDKRKVKKIPRSR